MTKRCYSYDVFISHAVEDKIGIANELYEKLCEKNLKVWYSGKELSIGDQVTETIYKSLENCRFGVVIISPNYISKLWALAEFFALFTRSTEQKRVVLPVLFNITPEELGAKFPPMANIFAIRSEKGIQNVADALFEVINRPEENKAGLVRKLNDSKAGWLKIVGLILALLVAGGYGISRITRDKPPGDDINKAIQNRITEVDRKASVEFDNISQTAILQDPDTAYVKRVFKEYSDAKSYFRNEYLLSTGRNVLQSKKHVEKAMGIDLDDISPANSFGLVSPDIRKRMTDSPLRQEIFVYHNRMPVKYSVLKTGSGEEFRIVVKYINPVRLVQTTLTFPVSSKDIKRKQISIIALLPEETFLVSHKDGALEITAE